MRIRGDIDHRIRRQLLQKDQPVEVRQGDVFWIDLDEPVGSGPGYRRPHVVIQGNYFNSRLDTVVVCALTSNLKYARDTWNVLLKRGEANLPKQSVVNVTHIFTIDKSELEEKIGSLTRDRVRQILKGIQELTDQSKR